MIRRAVIGLALAVCGSLAGASGVAATDDYTLPFYDPAVHLSYGVDRDSRSCIQRDWANQVWNDCALHYGRVYDNHTGMDYPMALLSKVAAARNGTVVDLFEGFGTEQFGVNGNYVLVSHADGRRTLYYHLAHNGVRVSVGDGVTAGKWIANSGCSGQCYGPHLHFEMRKKLASGAWTFVDPIFEQRFTTNPGRVPFLASYVRESNANTEVIDRYATKTHWVEFKNTGGRTWHGAGTGHILLGTWNPAERSSDFRAADWPSAWVATNLDQASVAPNGTGRFTFGLKAIDPPGTYDEDFNLYASGLHWFDWSGLGSFHIPIRVVDPVPPCNGPTGPTGPCL